MDTRELLKELFSVAVEASLPAAVLADFLPEAPVGRTLVLGAGKAASAMAGVVDEHWKGELAGLVVTRYGQAQGYAPGQCDSTHARIEVLESSHPVPDAAGQKAAIRILELCADLST